MMFCLKKVLSVLANTRFETYSDSCAIPWAILRQRKRMLEMWEEWKKSREEDTRNIVRKSNAKRREKNQEDFSKWCGKRKGDEKDIYLYYTFLCCSMCIIREFHHSCTWNFRQEKSAHKNSELLLLHSQWSWINQMKQKITSCY